MKASNEQRELEFENNGEITSDGAEAIKVDAAGTKSVNVTNNGHIRGNIHQLSADERATEMSGSIQNGKSGVWEANFLNIFQGVEAVPITQITNDGTIRTQGTGGGEKGVLKSKVIQNSGVIDIRDNSLIIEGDYVGGENPRITTGGPLEGDETKISTLTIKGKVTGETSKVRVENLGGKGGATIGGITVVTAVEYEGSGFTKKGRIIAGAYEYDLVRIETGEGPSGD
ncbi:hypothetical protein HBD59_000016 [Salmonella enterica]|nr:hypothetical protein [Salmonella enterica]EEU3908432.1 hypothetical protein [Salmonella enterica]EGY4577538.1 hypothetical protein [Salmonella enterica]EGY4584362.1 hypothetical protein [Salmonella enterica]EGY9841622.1 hypothetical protein [Salmonella enterica]